jgi:glycosyltransferase
MLRFLEKYKISTYYIPEVLVKMRIGGKSNKNLKNVLTVTIEEYRAWKINGFKNGFLPALLIKMRKIPQFFLKP